MGTAKRGSERREDALSRARIIEAAVELLDDEGESGLTFRALATRLATGAGAIYWHIANKNELLAHAYPFVRKLATHLPKHDDLAEFLAGIEPILTGIEASR
ncbi:helix-turn-helix transcriptional regulator [Myxococcaceae bacterium JPH2]|nr:helix-turn-helix transcriptional regulator [Myxococcaceae bacterium JPH2]